MTVNQEILPAKTRASGQESRGKKIAMIVHAYYLKDARVRRYAELLAKQGHQVDVICLREGREAKKEVHLGVNIHRIDLGRIRGGRLSYLYEYAASFLRFFFMLNRLAIRFRGYDLVHVHNMPDFLVYCTLFQRLFGCPVILDVHDLVPEVYQSKYNLESDHWLTRLFKIEERVSVRFASAIIAANHAFGEILTSRNRKLQEARVVMNAPDSMFFLSDEDRNAFRANKHDGDFHVIYIGTLAPRYGLKNAVRSIAKLNDSGAVPGLRFSIIPKISNEGEYLAEVLAEIEQLGLSDVFNLMEPVPHDQMPGVIAQADALIYAPVPDVHMDIALSLKIPEAIAVGCPVVASRLSVNSRYFGDEALYMFTPGDDDECAERLREVYGDPALRARKITAARGKLSSISWQKQAAGYTELVEELTMETVSQRVQQ